MSRQDGLLSLGEKRGQLRAQGRVEAKYKLHDSISYCKEGTTVSVLNHRCDDFE